MERRSAALAGRLEGKTYQQIARELGISRQRVQQLISPPRDIRDLVSERAGGKCEECGILPRDPHIHHKGAVGLGPDIYNDAINLQLLCASCHRKAHPATTSAATAKRVRQPRREAAGDDQPPITCLHCQYTWEARVRTPKQCPGCGRSLRQQRILDAGNALLAADQEAGE